MKVSDQKQYLSTRAGEIEMENVEFLMSQDGGSLTVEGAAMELGVDADGLRKRMTYRTRKW